MEDRILLAHGSGGKLGHDLVEQVFVPLFDNAFLNRLAFFLPVTLDTALTLAGQTSKQAPHFMQSS